MNKEEINKTFNKDGVTYLQVNICFCMDFKGKLQFTFMHA